MKVKTACLSDMALCYVMCMIEMPHLVWGETIGIHHASHQIVVPELPEPKRYSPFMSWEMIGPIIERESIDLVKMGIHQWRADCGPARTGPTPLIAAMRCYCTFKLGDEVEIPEELV